MAGFQFFLRIRSFSSSKTYFSACSPGKKRVSPATYEDGIKMTEKDVFAELGFDYLEPKERNVF